MIRSSGIYKMYKKVEMEVDNNKELVCAGSETAIMLFPIAPSSFFYRLLIVCFYVLLYNVNAHDRYFEMKGRFLNDNINNIVIADEETDSEEEITLLDDMDIETDEDDDDEDDDDEDEDDEDEDDGDEDDDDEDEDEDDSSYHETDDSSDINDGNGEDDGEDDGEHDDEDDGESKKDK